MGRPEAFARVGLSGVRLEGETLSRGDLLLRSALAAAAVYGLGAVEPHMRQALAARGGSDVETLNYLLPFEYLQASLYNRATSGKNAKGERMPLDETQKQLLETLLAEDGQHVDALKKAIGELGGKPVGKGGYAFAYVDFDSALLLAGQIEAAAVGAYNGAIPSVKSAELRELLSSIVQVDGRHAAAVRIPIKEEPAPEAFDIGLEENSAITLVQQFTGVFPDY